MTINVGKINPVRFRSTIPFTKPIYSDDDEIKVTELNKTTPYVGIKTPQAYSKLGVSKLDNGLSVYSYKLANGHRVSVIPMEDSPVIVKNYVNVGSMNETDDIKGISHFLEHMAFNGTNGSEGYIKLNRGDSFKMIDELGGWTNASTNYSLTDYVNSTPMLNNSDLEKQIRVIAAMSEDLQLSSDMIEKEKFPVCSEIDMILDSPETIALDQTVRSLFNVKSSADELVGGSVEHIKNLDRQKVLDYYNKYYTPDNMHLVITGNVNPDEVMQIVSKNFHSKKVSNGKRYDEKLSPIENNVRKDFITDKATSANIIIGFSGHKTNDIKSEVISDVVLRYIYSADCGLSDELKKLGAYSFVGNEKISTNSNNPTLNYYEVDCTDANSEKVLKLIFDKFSNLKITDEKVLNNIKEYLKMNYNDSLEHSEFLNTCVGKSAFDGNFDFLANYNSILEEITLDDVNNYIKNYMNISKAAVTVVHPETTEKTIMNNYKEAQSITFKGNTRKPINTDKVLVAEFDNNYRVAFSESKNNNAPFNIILKYDIPKDVNPATFLVLSQILSKGTMNMPEKEFKKTLENNSISVAASAGKDTLVLSGHSSASNFEKTTQKAYELLYSPRIKEAEVKEAIEHIKDVYSRYDKSSGDLYEEYESKNNPHYDSLDEILSGLDKVTMDDVQSLYNYIIKNSKGIITVNIPETSKDMKTRAYNEFSKFKPVQPFEYEIEKIYTDNQKPVVLTKEKNVSQAEITQTYKYQTDGSIKEKLTAILMNSILSSSNSIGLFNSLREHDHLAYRVNSSNTRTGDCGEISLFILTTTDNKDRGVTSYDNLSKSINGFNRQINKLVNSEYTDTDLETAKRALKASFLNKETVYSKMNSISNAIGHGETPDYDNRAFELIDSITREDIDNLSKRVFAGKPIYSIVASKETLDYNKEYLDSLTS